MSLSIEIIDLKNYKKTNLCIYQRLIGKLMYFSYGIKPDITFIVRQLSRHITNLRKYHFQAAKRVVRYLKKTIKMGVIFGQ